MDKMHRSRRRRHTCTSVKSPSTGQMQPPAASRQPLTGEDEDEPVSSPSPPRSRRRTWPGPLCDAAGGKRISQQTTRKRLPESHTPPTTHDLFYAPAMRGSTMKPTPWVMTIRFLNFISGLCEVPGFDRRGRGEANAWGFRDDCGRRRRRACVIALARSSDCPGGLLPSFTADLLRGGAVFCSCAPGAPWSLRGRNWVLRSDRGWSGSRSCSGPFESCWHESASLTPMSVTDRTAAEHMFPMLEMTG